MRYKEECCGNCKHHVNQDGEWICLCPESDGFTEPTDYGEWCCDWEGRDAD